MNWMFHGSSIGNLQVIEPRVSEHGQAYVYGALNKYDTLWYCVDFKAFSQLPDENMRIDESKVRKHYSGKSGYIYILEKEDFKYNSNIGHWISSEPVSVIHCEKIEDIFETMSSRPGFFYLPLEQIKGKVYPKVKLGMECTI